MPDNDLNILFEHSGKGLCFSCMSGVKLVTNPSNSCLVNVKPRYSKAKDMEVDNSRSFGSLASRTLKARREDAPPHNLLKIDCIIFSHSKPAALSVRPQLGASAQKALRNADRLDID